MENQRSLMYFGIVILAVIWSCATISQVNAKAGVVIAISNDDHEHFQFGEPGKAVFGAYSWTSPEGYTYIFRYVADSAGFRIRGPAIPVDTDGMAANGEQVNPETPEDGFILT